MNIEQITHLIILATALVGLYKAAAYRPRKSEEHVPGSPPSHLSQLFTGLLSFAGVFAFMLLMPAFIWAFTGITKNIGETSKNLDRLPQYAFSYKLSEAPTNFEFMLVAASQIPNENQRGTELGNLAMKALKKCDVRVALAAATAIPNDAKRGSALSKVIEVLDGGSCD